MHKNENSVIAAKNTAKAICDYFGIECFSIGMILGTGWAAVPLEIINKISLTELPGFENLPLLKGHPRVLIHAKFNNQDILILQGRIHMNEELEEGNIRHAVRLQTEMMILAGVKKLIITSAVGALHHNIKQGDVVVINKLVTAFAPFPLVLRGGEFTSPQDSFSKRLIDIAIKVGTYVYRTNKVKTGTHVMYPGPQFETNLDKVLFADAGGTVVGMSTLPEILVSSLYVDEGFEFLALGFVTNGTKQTDHEYNMNAAKEKAQDLGNLLKALLCEI